MARASDPGEPRSGPAEPARADGRDRDAPAGRSRPPLRRGTNALGRYGEEVAARRLSADGLRILERNWRCVEGELDIVALDGETLAVCEVKTRSERSFQQPSEAIDTTKAERLRRLAERWLSERWPLHFALLAEGIGGPETATEDPLWPTPAPPGGVRIDLVAVINRIKGAASVDHLRGAV
ncbi:YraN family protein [Kitasatospora sp. NBC_00315]|uniref:YraN family protein n=1 Tax=Kitasatospora sp. NBC_00315 TaxID=2975963 RepID=UPI00352F6092